ncbi:condensin subunit ScpA [Roseivirga pacifica]|uniref:Segregation and condensation protein A n=1 Tax=Roseivirga pacifica TaxID=1267423 RepID=A0A1I0NJA1_9BACT|nr:segregation/condensation protein A [Roseivirga pacifica]MCO6359756.1 chromosome segregation protein ScpA [Roseivirga pacifica]MCO6367126.1 chromosome segregation protein ScpA [Roseivirga pacifica]MCO6370342.1 chromosome segregation protein ScpA [Roseivirga pacifica]MCO6374783.1 chromosome segregation protein ScpA [Roseivirga pacifica]MCO6380041.1 chromosome segregation protein ScpA [Roseivirga pacifica]
MSFEIKLPLFEGPFDLLLFFIQRDELDIHDIPIHQITKDFLDYMHHLEQMNVEVASEFILVAATLMRIKAKMLLPRPTLDDEGNEVDPREELVRHLLEYKKYKSVVEELANMENARSQKEARGNVVKELKKLAEGNNVEAELQNVDLYKLLRVYQSVLSRYEYEQKKPTHEVVQYPYSISVQRDFIMAKLVDSPKLSFEKLIAMEPNKIAVIFNFLSILDLLQMKKITMHLGEGFNNFWIEKIEEEEQLVGQ